jgi:hypothetical protein
MGRLVMRPNKSYFNRWDYSQDDWECRRDDEQNLIDQFLNKSVHVPGFEGTKGFLAQNRGDLLNLDFDKTDYLLGNYLQWSFMITMQVTKIECLLYNLFNKLIFLKFFLVLRLKMMF